MQDEVSGRRLKAALGKKVEVIAFGITYAGTLKKIDQQAGTIRIEDRRDYAVLEIERIESFTVVSR